MAKVTDRDYVLRSLATIGAVAALVACGATHRSGESLPTFPESMVDKAGGIPGLVLTDSEMDQTVLLQKGQLIGLALARPPNQAGYGLQAPGFNVPGILTTIASDAPRGGPLVAILRAATDGTTEVAAPYACKPPAMCAGWTITVTVSG